MINSAESVSGHPLLDSSSPVSVEGMTSVSVWFIDLNDIALSDDTIDALLSSAERERSTRMRDRQQARLWCVIRASLRLRLAQRLCCCVSDIVFDSGEHGKPCCGDVPFNVSHSGDIGLLALAHQTTASLQIGVDVERLDRRQDVLSLARIVCSDHEYKALSSLAEVDRDEAFTRTWTRKESWLKARGVGLGFGATRVHVGIGEMQEPVIVDDVLDPHATLADLPAPPGYAMAICCLSAEPLPR